MPVSDNPKPTSTPEHAAETAPIEPLAAEKSAMPDSENAQSDVEHAPRPAIGRYRTGIT
jgi:hypothetical protein